jgi:hypothetical protein
VTNYKRQHDCESGFWYKIEIIWFAIISSLVEIL